MQESNTHLPEESYSQIGFTQMEVENNELVEYSGDIEGVPLLTKKKIVTPSPVSEKNTIYAAVRAGAPIYHKCTFVIKYNQDSINNLPAF